MQVFINNIQSLFEVTLLLLIMLRSAVIKFLSFQHIYQKNTLLRPNFFEDKVGHTIVL